MQEKVIPVTRILYPDEGRGAARGSRCFILCRITNYKIDREDIFSGYLLVVDQLNQ